MRFSLASERALYDSRWRRRVNQSVARMGPGMDGMDDMDGMDAAEAATA
jgi:hypothetical protein